MKILHITTEYPPVIWGGLGTAVGGLTKALVQENHLVGVLLVSSALVPNQQLYGSWKTFSMKELKEQFINEKFICRDHILFFQVSPDEALSSAYVLSDYWLPDVIHLHTAWLLPVAMSIRQRCNCPIVFTVHSIDKAEYEVGKIFTHWEVQEQAIHEADRIIAISESEKEMLAEYYPQAINKVCVAGNGIEDFNKALLVSIKRKWKETDLTILYTGRFVERKGIWDLIAAIPIVLDSFPKARFVVAGGYGGGAEIEREWLVDTLKPFKDRVLFTGWLTPAEINQWYENADILVIPSWYEPFGMVVLEGMLYGLPIVATNIGGPAEILTNNVSAVLVPPKNANALAESILDLLKSSSLRKQLGEAAAKEVRNKWLWNKALKKIQHAYSEAICCLKHAA